MENNWIFSDFSEYDVLILLYIKINYNIFYIVITAFQIDYSQWLRKVLKVGLGIQVT